MIYFVSDLHLGLGDREADRRRERDFVTFLRRIKDHCEALYIVGDLFDYWFDYHSVIPKDHFRCLAALDDLRSSGVPIHYLIGNHDFGHKWFFEQELDIRIHRQDLAVEHQGKRLYLAHGDGKALNDRGYLVLRAILRNRLCQWLYRWIHPDIGIGLAASTSRKSRGYTDARDYGDSDGLQLFARRKIEDEGFDYVVMGHRHLPLVRPFGEGHYINLGDWLVHRTFARLSGGELELLKVDDFLLDQKVA